MKRWKLAVSMLAVLGGVSAPFILGTWKQPTSLTTWTSLTPDQKTRIEHYLDETDNCKKLKATDDVEPYHGAICALLLEQWSDGGVATTVSRTQAYWAENLAVGVGTLLTIFGLAVAVPAVFRRYWGWLRT